MKRFLLLTLSMSALCFLPLAVYFALLPVGRIGDVYPRITTPRQQSLVLGSSRAAQGINPALLDSAVTGIYAPGIYNFAFHIDLSTYNEQYIRAIHLKLAPYDGQHNWFILSVDPWMLNASLEESSDLQLRSVSHNPNLEFLIKHFQRKWLLPLPTHTFVNERGRTEVDYKAHSEHDRQRHMAQRIAVYEEKAVKYAYSEQSEALLDSLIGFLSARGDVYLVRIPVEHTLLQLEERICPSFSERINRLSRRHNVPYLDFSSDTTFMTNDGNHLTQSEGDRFSRILGRSIRSIAK